MEPTGQKVLLRAAWCAMAEPLMAEQQKCSPQGFLKPLRDIPHHRQATASGGANFCKGCQEKSATRLDRLQQGPDIGLLQAGLVKK